MNARLLYSPFAEIRWSTIAGVVAILAFVTWRTRRPGLAVLTVLAWVGLYELVFDAAQFIHGETSQTLAGLAWMAGAIGVAPVFARHLGVRLWWPAALVWAAGMLAWVITGYHRNVPGVPGPLDPLAEAFNVLTKDGLALAYLVGAWRLLPGRLGARWRERLHVSWRVRQGREALGGQ